MHKYSLTSRLSPKRSTFFEVFEKDAASKERLHAARKAIADIEEKLQPLKAAYENEKQRGEELNQAKKKLDELKAKAEDAERRLVYFSFYSPAIVADLPYNRYDLATASDLRYYAIPEVEARIKKLEEKKAAEEAQTGGGTDVVTADQIAEIVAKWTSIPVTRLVTSEREKLLKLEKVLAQSVVGQNDAVKAVASAIRLSRSGLSNPNRPVASFLMAGPSGTGKTLMTKTVSPLFIQIVFPDY